MYRILIPSDPEVLDLTTERGVLGSPVKNRHRLMGLVGELLAL